MRYFYSSTFHVSDFNFYWRHILTRCLYSYSGETSGYFLETLIETDVRIKYSSDVYLSKCTSLHSSTIIRCTCFRINQQLAAVDSWWWYFGVAALLVRLYAQPLRTRRALQQLPADPIRTRSGPDPAVLSVKLVCVSGCGFSVWIPAAPAPPRVCALRKQTSCVSSCCDINVFRWSVGVNIVQHTLTLTHSLSASLRKFILSVWGRTKVSVFTSGHFTDEMFDDDSVNMKLEVIKPAVWGGFTVLVFKVFILVELLSSTSAPSLHLETLDWSLNPRFENQ